MPQLRLRWKACSRLHLGTQPQSWQRKGITRRRLKPMQINYLLLQINESSISTANVADVVADRGDGLSTA